MLSFNDKSAERLAALALPRRRVGFRLLWEALRRTRPMPSLNLSGDFQKYIRLPARDAAKLAREADFHDLLTLLEWGTFKNRTLDQLIADSQRAVIDNEAALARMAQDGRPLILAPVHMGAYVFALATLMHRYFRGRRVLILRNHADDQDQSSIMSRLSELGCDVRFMAIRDKSSFIDALRFARRDAIIVCMVDLPASYGVPVETELFGRPARLGMGIDALARACNAIVVPLCVTSQLRSELITVGQPFEVAATDSPHERARVANIIRRHIEASILSAPEQWHMWPRIAEYLIAPDPSSELSELPEQQAS